MNFGLSEVPVTTIDLQKHVSKLTIKDSAGENVIASAQKQENGEWKIEGDVLPLENSTFDISIENEKLQGARLEVTYTISADISVEKDYNGEEGVEATITGLVDYIDNDLSYNEQIGDNSKYWENTDYETTKSSFESAAFINSKGQKIVRTGTQDPEGKIYTTIVKAKDDNPLLQKEGGKATITLEKILSSADNSIADIILSNIDTYEYDNRVEITGIEYKNSQDSEGAIYRDRVRTAEKSDPAKSRMIILAGAQYDYAISESITIHPPTGENNNTIYYVIAVISISILSAGIVLIKKYAIVKK